MTQWNKKKVLSFVLAVLLILTALPFDALNSIALAEDGEATQNVTILHNDAAVETLTLAEDGEEVLTAALAGITAESYAWQLCLDEAQDIWVTVSDRTEATCKVNYALVKSSLDTTGTTRIRCAVTADGAEYISESVAITVSYLVPQAVSYEYDDAAAVSVAAYDAGIAMASYPVTVASDGSSTSDTTYTAAILFLYEDGTTAWEPSLCKIDQSADDSYTVEIKNVSGYVPIYFSTGEPGGTLSYDEDTKKYTFTIDATKVTEDVTYRVTYVPAYTDYKVVHHLQDLSSDLFGTSIMEYFTGPTGSLVTGDLHKSGDPTASNYDVRFVGFTHLAYQSLEIAADGQTQIDIYYNRIYYKVDFDLVSKTAYGTNSIYVRYGTEVYPKTPTYHGYTFGGWDLVGIGTGETYHEPTDVQKAQYDLNSGSISVPAYNLKYRAIWTTADSSYTVVYWKETPDSTGENGEKTYEYWGSVVHGYVTLEDGGKEYTGSVKSGDPIYPDTTCQEYASTQTVQLWDVPTTVSTTTEYGVTFDSSVYFTYNDEKTKKVNESVTVEGDGTSVINIYYDRQVYELKFYYAATKGTTTYVIGGSTYFFGADATSNTGDDVALFTQYLTGSDGNVGQVDALPSLKQTIKDENKYTEGTTTSGEYTLHWISFTAKYGADLSKLWPVDVFTPVNRTTNLTANGWDQNAAYASAWNGEHHVWYTQHNSNQTIKGKYNKLDFRLLWDKSVGGSYADTNETTNAPGGTVAYLCFWENGGSTQTWSVPSLYRYKIWLECADMTADHGHEANGEKQYGSKWYCLADTYDTVDNSTVDEQTDPPMDGFDYVGRTSSPLTSTAEESFDSYREAYEVNFFYDRIRYDLKFNNHGTYLKNRDENGNDVDHLSIRYGVSLWTTNEDGTSAYDLQNVYTVDENGNRVLRYYPENLEKDAYDFVGWYTTPTFAAGTEFVFNKDTTMPAGDLELYAYWKLKEHKVWIYASEADAEARQNPIYPNGATVTHGSKAPTPDDPATVDGMVFNGWYYKTADGSVQRWLFSNAVTSEMHIYAGYISKVPVEYTIQYVLIDGYDENGDPKVALDSNQQPVKVAPDLTAYGLAGTHITVRAKTGSELYDTYSSNYFPEPITQDLNLSLNGTNIKTIYYSYKAAVPYTVKYVDANNQPIIGYFDENGDVVLGGETALVKEVKDNKFTVVTESYVDIPNYRPDALQKSLVISAKEEENVLTFVYTESNTSDTNVVQVIEYVETRTNDVFTEYSNIVYDAYTGNSITYTVRNLSGFEFSGKLTEINGTVKPIDSDVTSFTEDVSGNLLIEVFYERKNVNYTIDHVKVDADDTRHSVDADKVTGSGMHGETIYAYANTYPGYALVENASTSRMLTLTAEFDGTDPNYILFEYHEQSATFTYKTVLGDTGVVDTDWLTINNEVKNEEIVAAATGTASGSKLINGTTGTYTASDGHIYRFVGWYQNEACTVPVDAGWVDTDGTLTPKKSSTTGIYTSATYYAKFERAMASLTIETKFLVGQGVYSALDPGKTWIFRITGLDENNKEIDLRVTVHGKGSVTVVDLPVGNYQIEELSEWTWRYTMERNPRNVSLTSAGHTETFIPVRQEIYWLDGNAYKVNKFTANEQP